VTSNDSRIGLVIGICVFASVVLAAVVMPESARVYLPAVAAVTLVAGWVVFGMVTRK